MIFTQAENVPNKG